MNNRQLVNHITTRLQDKGVTVDVHPAITTNSFYLTFDGGVLKKARVGDHKGKGYHYTYEIGKHVQPPYEVELTYKGSTYTRYRYTDEQVEDLITQVLILRSNLRVKYGKTNYETFRDKALGKTSKQQNVEVLASADGGHSKFFSDEHSIGFDDPTIVGNYYETGSDYFN